MSESLDQRRQELRQQAARLRRRIDGQLRTTARPAFAAASWRVAIAGWAGRMLFGLGLGWLATQRTHLEPTLRRLWRLARWTFRTSRNGKPGEPVA